MKSYKGWSPAERTAMDKLMKKAIAEGEIPPPTVCNRCKQDKGIIQYHSHDYSHPTKYLEPLCWRCHMMTHRRFSNPLEVCEYFEEVWLGKQYPAIHYPDFSQLSIHGIPTFSSKKEEKVTTADILRMVKGKKT
jgi:hypothetical protein